MEFSLPDRFQELLFTFHWQANYRREMLHVPELVELAQLSNFLALAERYFASKTDPAQAQQLFSSMTKHRLELLSALESRYGDRHYDDRKHLLESTLGKLKQDGHDLETIFTVLDHAKTRMRAHLIGGRELDRYRQRKEGLDVIFRNLRKWLRHAKLIALDEPPDEIFRTMETLFALLNVEERRGAVAQPEKHAPTRLRRPKAGHQPEPWIGDARQGLRKAGVTRVADREDLLTAVGLIRFRP